MKIDFTSFLAWTFINYLVYCDSCRVGDVIFRLRTHNTWFFLFFKKINIRSGIIIDLNAYQSKIVFCSGEKCRFCSKSRYVRKESFHEKFRSLLIIRKRYIISVYPWTVLFFRGDFHNIILLTFKMIILAAKFTGWSICIDPIPDIYC